MRISHMDLNIIKRTIKVANKTTGAMFSSVFSEILIFSFFQENVNGKYQSYRVTVTLIDRCEKPLNTLSSD